MKATALLTLILALSLSSLALRSDLTAMPATEAKRDQELFLAGAKAFSERRFDEGRILLNTMINTYTESPLREQAQLLVFYSYAKQRGPKNEKAAMLLKDMEEQMKAYEPKRNLQ